MISLRSAILAHLSASAPRRIRSLLTLPPSLPEDYGIDDYASFMTEETWQFSRRYACRRVTIHHTQRLTHLNNGARSVLAFLHYGSFFLMGGALAHQLGLAYSAIASRRNALSLDDLRKNFWLGVYQRTAQLYENPLLYTDQSPRLALDWLEKPGHVLGVALDVR